MFQNIEIKAFIVLTALVTLKMTYKIFPSYIRNRDGIYHFIRRIPVDLQGHYRSDRVCLSLRTKSEPKALQVAGSISQRLEDYWSGLCLQKMDVPAIHLLISDNDDARHDSPTLKEAVEAYLILKGGVTNPVFARTARRNGRYVITALSNRPINAYSSADAAKFQDYLFDKSLSLGSVRRIFGSVRSIINLVMREQGIEGTNAFTGTYMPQRYDQKERQPIPSAALSVLQQNCKNKDDEACWLIALINEMGMRLAEAAGLAMNDIYLDEELPHISIRTHSWRRLKTRSSERVFPLVGASLWAAKRLHQRGGAFAFPRYCNTEGYNANSASAALNKWMKGIIGNEYVIHGLRHSLRDRLRAVEYPSDIIDQIGGWTTESVGHGYGRGYTLEVMAKWMNLTA
ncbi:tyrosine-type recombinase/integrase [Alphaproteobacteria bacterium]|nr:tyrosine-type recombinase/integrase [Alphaproteobacteria bacterium]